MSKIHELNFLEPIWSQWPQISPPKLSSDEKSLPRKFLGRLDFTRFIDNPSRLLDDCCYSTRTYSTSTFTFYLWGDRCVKPLYFRRFHNRNNMIFAILFIFFEIKGIIRVSQQKFKPIYCLVIIPLIGHFDTS